eukprot:312190-Rhodomonas_salina.1
MSGTGVGHSTATVCFYTVSSTDELDGGTRHMELEGLGDIGERTTALDSLRYHPTPYPGVNSRYPEGGSAQAASSPPRTAPPGTAIRLPASYALPGTNLAYLPTRCPVLTYVYRLRTAYAPSGTNLAYLPTRCPVLSCVYLPKRCPVLSNAYLPTRFLDDVRY